MIVTWQTIKHEKKTHLDLHWRKDLNITNSKKPSSKQPHRNPTLPEKKKATKPVTGAVLKGYNLGTNMHPLGTNVRTWSVYTSA